MKTIKEMQKEVADFRDERDWKQYHKAKNLAIGISLEAAEVLDHIRFRSDIELEEYMSDENNKKQVSHELADVLIYTLAFFDAYNIDIDKAFEEKLDINKKKYPVDKSKGKKEKSSEL